MGSKLYSQSQKLRNSRQTNKQQPQPISKLTSRDIGNEYEQVALNYLLKQGLSFIERNFQIYGGELDLIMQDADTLIFVEVKYRTSVSYGMPYETVNKKKMQRIYKAAMVWMAQHNIASNHCHYRFDIISISDNNSHLEWLQNIMLEGYKAN